MRYYSLMKPSAFSTLILLGSIVCGLAQASPNTNAPATPTTVTSAVFSPDGKLVLTNPAGSTVKIWDVATGKPLSLTPNHVGTWRLLSFKYGDATEWSSLPETQLRVKHITEAHFIWVQYETNGNVQTTAGGTCTLIDAAYTETIVYAGQGMTDYLGKKQPFTLRV
jgi:WD40 repeat protein